MTRVAWSVRFISRDSDTAWRLAEGELFRLLSAMASIVRQFMCFVLLLFLHNSYGDDPQPQQIHLASTGKVIKQESRLFLTTLFTTSTWCLPPASNLVSQCILTRNLTFFFLLIDLIQVRKQKSEKLPLIVLSFMWLKSMWLKTLHNAYKNFIYKELGIECPVFQFLEMLSLFLSSSWISKVVLRRRFRISSWKECTRKTLMHNGVDNFYPSRGPRAEVNCSGKFGQKT